MPTNLPMYVIFGGMAVPVGPGSGLSINGNGLWHSTGSVLDANAYNGNADQILVTNHANTDTLWVTAGPDVSYANTVWTVVGFQGRTVSNTAPTVGQVYSWNGTTWAPATSLTTFGADLSNTSTSVAQYVDSLSFSATGFSHSTGGPIPVNGDGTLLNWVDSQIKLQQGGVTLLQANATSADFLSLGSSAAASGLLRVPAISTNIITGKNGGTTINVLGFDGTPNLFLNGFAGGTLNLQLGGTTQAALTASALSLTPSSLLFTGTAGVLASVAFTSTGSGTGASMTVAAQPAGGASNNGGSLLLMAGAATGGGTNGTVSMYAAGVVQATLSTASLALLPNLLQFTASAGAATLINFATAAASGSGSSVTLQAQTGSAGSFGGQLNLTAGSGGSGTSSGGGVNITGGAASGGGTPGGIFFNYAGSQIVSFGAVSGLTSNPLIAWSGVSLSGNPFGSLASSTINWLTLSGGSAISVAGTNPFPLTAAQAACPIIALTGTVPGGNFQVTLPNNIGASWQFDVTSVTFSGNSIVFTTGSGTSVTVPAPSGARKLVLVSVTASNVVAAVF